MGKSSRTIQGQGTKQPAHLNSQQSSAACQYAKVLELAINVFGTQKLAEEWLGRPSKYLDGDVPLDMMPASLLKRLLRAGMSGSCLPRPAGSDRRQTAKSSR